jgi:hypothetical protein
MDHLKPDQARTSRLFLDARRPSLFHSFVVVAILTGFFLVLLSIHNNSNYLATIVKNQAEITQKGALGNLSVQFSNVEAQVTSVGQNLNRDEIMLRKYYQYLLYLRSNLTAMREKEDASDSLLRNNLESLQHRIDEVQEHWKHANSTMLQLDHKISQPGEPFSLCTVERESCAAGSDGNGRYWKSCSTRFLPEEKNVSRKTYDCP